MADPIIVEDARIVGALTLEDRKLDHPLILRNCYVEEEINLRQAEIPRVDLSGSHLWGLDAEQLHTKHDLDLHGVVTTGTAISVLGARIGGCLLLGGARLSNLDGTALEVEGVEVAQNVYARGMTVFGPIGMVGAHVEGHLWLDGARLVNPGAVTLDATRARIDQSVVCTDGFHSTGEVQLLGAQVGGNVTFDGGAIRNATGNALSADGITVNGSAFFRDGFSAHGGVDLLSALIGGQVAFTDATLVNPGTTALSCQGMQVGQSMFFNGITTKGEIRLLGTRIRGQLGMTDVRLANLGGDALHADNLVVGEGLFRLNGSVTGSLRMIGAQVCGELNLDGVRVKAPEAIQADNLVAEHALFCCDADITGEISLAGARVSWLDLTGTKVDNEYGAAIKARGLRVDQDVLCRDMTITGDVRMLDAQIGGRLDFSGATISSPEGYGVDLEGLRAGSLRLLPEKPVDGVVDLVDAKVGSFSDDPETWPDELRLRGFGYEALDDAPVRQRLKWLRRNEGGYSPGVYDNLAAAYRREGRVEYARKVAIAKQWHRRTEFNPLAKAWNWMLYLTVGYGYRTNRAGLWLMALLAAGTAVFANAVMTPAGPTVEAFNPFVYALDVLLPIVDLGQQRSWVPKGAAQWWSWGLTAAGWILTTAVVAGITNALKRD